jgi:uracil-DNA glycosylase
MTTMIIGERTNTLVSETVLDELSETGARLCRWLGEKDLSRYLLDNARVEGETRVEAWVRLNERITTSRPNRILLLGAVARDTFFDDGDVPVRRWAELYFGASDRPSRLFPVRLAWIWHPSPRCRKYNDKKELDATMLFVRQVGLMARDDER